MEGSKGSGSGVYEGATRNYVNHARGNGSARGNDYVSQAALLEKAAAGDFMAMHDVLDLVLSGKSVLPDAAKHVILTVDRLAKGEGFSDVGAAGAVLETVLERSSCRYAEIEGCEGRRYTRRIDLWNPALRANDAHYALRVLAENPVFGDAGYTPDRLVRLANGFNADVANGYTISGVVTATRKEKPNPAVYDIDFGNGTVTIRKPQEEKEAA